MSVLILQGESQILRTGNDALRRALWPQSDSVGNRFALLRKLTENLRCTQIPTLTKHRLIRRPGFREQELRLSFEVFGF
jgi:hypothetical protein